MNRFEYTVEEITSTQLEDIESFLDDFGYTGWELVNYEPLSHDPEDRGARARLIFKRDRGVPVLTKPS